MVKYPIRLIVMLCLFLFTAVRSITVLVTENFHISLRDFFAGPLFFYACMTLCFGITLWTIYKRSELLR